MILMPYLNHAGHLIFEYKYNMDNNKDKKKSEICPKADDLARDLL